MCKNMERENSHLCQYTPAQCMHSRTHKHTQTRTHTHAHLPPSFNATRLFVKTLISQHYVQLLLKKSWLAKFLYPPGDRENENYKFTSARLVIKV